MKFKKLVLELCRREAKKSQVNVANMSEIVGSLADIVGTLSLKELVDLAVELQKIAQKRKN